MFTSSAVRLSSWLMQSGRKDQFLHETSHDDVCALSCAKWVTIPVFQMLLCWCCERQKSSAVVFDYTGEEAGVSAADISKPQQLTSEESRGIQIKGQIGIFDFGVNRLCARMSNRSRAGLLRQWRRCLHLPGVGFWIIAENKLSYKHKFIETFCSASSQMNEHFCDF